MRYNDLAHAWSDIQRKSSYIVSPSTRIFYVAQSEGGRNRIEQVLTFAGIPAGAHTCQLKFDLPQATLVSGGGRHTVTVAKAGASPSQDQEKWNWCQAKGRKTVASSGSFGTIDVRPGNQRVINSMACPVGGGELRFVVGVAFVSAM